MQKTELSGEISCQKARFYPKMFTRYLTSTEGLGEGSFQIWNLSWITLTLDLRAS